MRYLVDANILSEPLKPRPNAKAANWLLANEAALAVDPIILGEIQFGILVIPDSSRRRRLEQWFLHAIQKIHCFAWEAKIGLRWAKLLKDLRTAGHAMPIKDSLIAATALHHGLTVATHNSRDFIHCGLKVIDPLA